MKERSAADSLTVAMGCSGSSGSTFFSQLLDRHPDIASGQELYLFSKPLLYDDYEFVRRRALLVRFLGLSSNPLDHGRALLKNLPAYRLGHPRVWWWVWRSRSLAELAGRFRRHVARVTGKRVWLEKTPHNIFCAGRFLEAFPEGKFIHIVRDPRDVVLSLMKRGRGCSPVRAAETWVTSVAAIWPWRKHPRVLEVRYEDLVRRTEEELRRVCAFLGVPFDLDHFRDDRHASRSLVKFQGHGNWSVNPGTGASDRSLNRYLTSDVDLAEIYSVRLTEAYAKEVGVRPLGLVELARSYGYLEDAVLPEGAAPGGRVLDWRKPKSRLKAAAHSLVERYPRLRRITY